MVDVSFSERLADLRESKNLKQRELGKLTNISTKAISNYENGNGNAPIDALVRLADFFDVSIDYLIARTDNRDVSFQFLQQEYCGYRNDVITVDHLIQLLRSLDEHKRQILLILLDCIQSGDYGEDAIQVFELLRLVKNNKRWLVVENSRT